MEPPSYASSSSQRARCRSRSSTTTYPTTPNRGTSKPSAKRPSRWSCCFSRFSAFASSEFSPASTRTSSRRTRRRTRTFVTGTRGTRTRITKASSVTAWRRGAPKSRRVGFDFEDPRGSSRTWTASTRREAKVEIVVDGEEGAAPAEPPRRHRMFGSGEGRRRRGGGRRERATNADAASRRGPVHRG